MSGVKLTADIISGFSGSLLQNSFDGPVESPECHREWWTYCTSDNPKVAIAAPRRHAKSTAVTLSYVLASVLFRDRSYVLIISDTITQATQFLNDIKQQLYDNDKIKTLFNIGSFDKDTEDDIIVNFTDGQQFRISAKGSEQKMRGLKWNNKRPDLIVGDDLENDEIVLNVERRTKFKRWFYGAVIPSLSTHGVIRIVGTILHEDSFLNNLMPSEWDKRTVITDLKTYRNNPRRGEWLSVKYRAHNDDFTKFLWPSHYTKEWFLATKQDFMDRGLPDVYSQEYLNIPIDESVAYFKRSDFLSETVEDRKTRLNYYITVDLAISEKETADYSVFLIAGVDENKILHVKNIIRDRMDGREIVDTILSLHKIYNPEFIGIEEMQVSKAIGPFLREEMVRTGTYPSVIPLKTMGKDKIARARSIQARCRAKSVKFDKSAEWYPIFEDECTKFPRGTRDDQVDAFAYMGLMLDSLIEAPTDKEVIDEEYYDQLRESGQSDSGRSAITGY
jgi:predicted phage terminase large subunit-like protein